MLAHKKSVLLALVVAVLCRTSLQVDENLEYKDSSSSSEELTKNLNDSDQNMYVIKATVYEVGILTDVDDNQTMDSFESQERVDLTFFDAHTNDSHIDLGTIPLPVETNVSGQVLTGIAPVHLGAFSNLSEGLQTLPLTGSLANILQSDTAQVKLTTSTNDSVSESTPAVLADAEPIKISDILNTNKTVV